MTIPGGYILQPRCIDDSDIMKEPPVVRELWFYLLRRVNHSNNQNYSRGTAFFNLGEIQNALSWYQGWRKRYYSKPQLTKSLCKLYERNMIATQKATRGLYITILNYDYYQDPKNYESNNERNMRETRKKQNGHAKNKNDKNERKKEPYPSDFEQFWQAYPRKIGKGAAYNEWQKKNGVKPELSELIKIVEQHKKSTQWQRDGGQYIPHPKTWISQERWLDELNVQNETVNDVPIT